MPTVGIPDESVVDNNIVGAPLPQEQAEWKPQLAGFGEDKVVTVFNPLPNDFRFQHARSVVQGAPLDKDRTFAEEKAGLSMRKEQQPMAHYSQYWILKAGESKNLPGDIAQKAVQDLVTYILMNRAGKGNPKNVADGYARGEVEKEIILAVHDSVAFMEGLNPVEKTQAQVDKLNPVQETQEPTEEPPNPPPGQGVSYESNRASGKTAKKA